jgi:glycosyltransferase involved in cell wall biosynthesis
MCIFAKLKHDDEMKQIAVIFEGEINKRLGVFNAVINRVKHLQEIADYKIDVYMFEVYDGWLMRCLRHSPKEDWRPDEIESNGIKVHVTWFRRRWGDVIMHRFFHQPPRAMLRRLHRLGWEMRGYDLVSAHDRIAGHAATFASKHLHIPCFITWHGSSIHTQPIQDDITKEMTIKQLKQVNCNFFVSQGLLDKARAEITSDFRAELLYNGASAQFQRYSDKRRKELREKYGLRAEDKVVAYIGLFAPVKNVTSLPEIYQKIQQKSHQPITFWAIGDGMQLTEVQQLMKSKSISCRFFGKVTHTEVPDILNCVDLLVLPSRQEGMPLVPIEALSCGARVIASNVGGSAEAVGRDNAIDLGENFVDRFTSRAVELLKGDIVQQVPQDMNWVATAEKENRIYHQYLDSND